MVYNISGVFAHSHTCYMKERMTLLICDLQKASMWKRISAALFDGILLSIAAVLFAWLLSVIVQYDTPAAVLNESYAKYEEAFGVDFDITATAYEAMSPEEKANLDAAYDALASDDDAVYAYNMMMQLTLLITTFGILLGYLLLEFVVPLLLKNGQTLGKKIFGIAVMRQEGVKVNGVVMFIRTILGKYAIETMIPVYIVIMIYFNSIGIVGAAVLLLILILQIVLIAATKTNSAIHDCLASTVTVDLASQMIFNTREEMIAYKEKLHAEKVANTPY